MMDKVLKIVKTIIIFSIFIITIFALGLWIGYCVQFCWHRRPTYWLDDLCSAEFSCRYCSCGWAFFMADKNKPAFYYRKACALFWKPFDSFRHWVFLFGWQCILACNIFHWLFLSITRLYQWIAYNTPIGNIIGWIELPDHRIAVQVDRW